jgi:hypothetical protein
MGSSTPIPQLTSVVYVNGNATQVPPGGSGVAPGTWSPPENILNGQNVVWGQITGTVYAPIVDPCAACNGGIIQVGDVPSGCTATTNMLPIFASSSMMEQARADRAVLDAPQAATEYLGFAAAQTGKATKVLVSAFQQVGAATDEFVVPAIGVSLAPPSDKYSSQEPFSGPLGPKPDIAMDRAFAEAVDVSAVADGGPARTQGLLKLVWPANSAGKRAIIEVIQVDPDQHDRRVGGFRVGLRRVSDPASQVWL